MTHAGDEFAAEDCDETVRMSESSSPIRSDGMAATIAAATSAAEAYVRTMGAPRMAERVVTVMALSEESEADAEDPPDAEDARDVPDAAALEIPHLPSLPLPLSAIC